VVYDTDTREVVRRQPIDMPSGTVGGLYSVDADAVYGFTDLTFGEGLYPNWRVELSTGEDVPMYEQQAYWRILERRGLARTLLVSHQESPAPADYDAYDGLQQLSVKGARVTPEGEQPLSVLDGLTGAEFTFSAPSDYPNTNPVWLAYWSDDDTVVLYSAQGDGIDLLECDISTGDCATAAQVSRDAIVADIGFADGEPTDG
jgi:hypothetical protein